MKRGRNSMKRRYQRFRVLEFFISLGIVLGMVTHVTAGVVIADLENALMCKCDDKCGKVVVNCTCDTAKETRKDFRKKLKSGLTVDQVIQVYVDKYGEAVLSAPSKSGFNLAVWLTPFAAILVGGLGIRKIVQTWLRTNGVSRSLKKEEVSEATAGKLSSQLQSELDKIET